MCLDWLKLQMYSESSKGIELLRTIIDKNKFKTEEIIRRITFMLLKDVSILLPHTFWHGIVSRWPSFHEIPL